MVFLVLFSTGIIILTKLYFLQIVSGKYYDDKLRRQHSFSKIIGPQRGEIYFRERDNALRLAATTKQGFLVYLNPKEMAENGVEPKIAYENIKDIFKEKNAPLPSEEKFLSLASKTDDPFEVIARRVEKELAQKTNDLNIKGIGVSPDEWRFYPAGHLASQTLGFVGYKDDKLVGRYGLEESYEDVLKGKAGYLKGEGVFADFMNFGKRIFNPPSRGYDLILTIDPVLQAFLEQRLEKTLKKWSGELAGGIIINPFTGKIMALSSKPDFDPNRYAETQNLSVFKNPAGQSRYEFGSIFKPLTLAAGLNEEVITSETKYIDKGALELNGYQISNFDKKARGEADMQKVLNESLNTGAVFVQQRIGKEKFYDYFRRYGLDSPVDLGIKGEISGDLRNLKEGRNVEYATASFGQGVSVTPLELARALSVLANGGYLVKPYIIERIRKPGLPDEILIPDIEEIEKNQIIKPETSEEISRMLAVVVDEALLQGRVKMQNYTAAAKTGTAQIPKQNERGYSEKYLHSIFVYTPAFEAKFLILLYLENPKGARYASESLGKTTMEIAEFALNYYEVPPDR